MVKIYLENVDTKNIFKNKNLLQKYIKKEYIIKKLQTLDDIYWIDNNKIYFYEKPFKKYIKKTSYLNKEFTLDYTNEFKINIISQLPVDYKLTTIYRFEYQYNNMKLILDGEYKNLNTNSNYRKKTLLDSPELQYVPVDFYLEYNEKFIQNKECLKENYKEKFFNGNYVNGIKEIDFSNSFFQDELNVFLSLLI